MTPVFTALAALSLALTLATPATAASRLEASVDHDVLHPGETVELRLRHSGDAPSAAPDLSPLAAGFEVLDTSQSHRLSITNGARETSVDWTVTLAPRSTGALTIPAITVGDTTSQPIALRVVEPSASDAATRKPELFLEASVDEAAPFVQGEVRYTVRIYDAAGIREGALTAPSADRLGVRALGEGRAYDEMIGGRRYRVHEREYALVPQASGALVVPPVTLDATLPDTGGARRGALRGSLFDRLLGDDDFFDTFFERGRPVRVRSNPVTLTVQARPEAAGDGWFLPARAVQLTREWSTTPPTFRVGEPIDQTIVVQALGASAEQLPALEVPAADGVKQYADAPETRTIPTGGGTVAERRQRYSLIPDKPGTLTLPAVEVRWWDVDAKEVRTATLAAETVQVLPAAGTSIAATEPTPTSNPAASEPTTADATTSGAASKALTGGVEAGETAATTSVVRPLAATLVGLALAALAWLAARRRRATSKAPPSSARDLLADVERACRAGDARATRAALLAWAAQRWSDAPPATTSEIARRLVAPALADALAELDRSLYGRATTTWTGATLSDALRAAVRARRDQRARASTDVLPSLYPRERAA